MKNRNWILSSAAIAINSKLCSRDGGLIGLRDEGLLESALARPENLAAYAEPSVFDLAAAYAFGVIQNHPFLDGNKRTGFLITYTFLGDNGWRLCASEAEAYAAIMSLARKEMSEAAFAIWLKENSKKPK